jgi:AcrR family transcriptional regulator
VVKSAVYRYFESREEILMRLLAADLHDLAAEFEARAAPLAGSDDVDAVARIFAEGCAARPRLCSLAAVLATVLERNAAEATLLEIKRDLLAAAARVNAAGAAACPAPGPDGWALVTRLAFSLLAGHWPFANPSPTVARVMERPEFAPLRKDFAEDLAQGVAAMLRGLSATR